MLDRLARTALLVIALLAPAGCGSLIVTDLTDDEIRERAGFDWVTAETSACSVHVEAGSTRAPSPAAIAGAADESKRRVLDGLGLDAYDARLFVFVVETRERMGDLIGRRTNATGFHTSNALCLVWPRAGRPGLTHEMVHVIAMNAWGVPERWINEGVAVDVTGPWIGRDVDAVCRILRERDELPSLDDLTRRFDRFPSAVSYPAAGSFVRFLRETYGLDAVRAVWNDGRRSLPAITGRTMDELESAWLARVDAAPIEGVEYDPRAVTPSEDR